MKVSIQFCFMPVLDEMKFQVEVTLFCLIGFICMQQGLCDELSTKSGINNWTCICSSSYQGNQSFFKENCSTSCDCGPAGEPSDGTWRCFCAANGFPKIAPETHDTSCFTGCNCTSGSFARAQRSRNHITGKVVIILLFCVILTTLAFLGSVTFYFYRKDKCAMQSTMFADRETSCTSATKLLNHKASSSATETRIRIDSLAFPISGCFQRASFFCRSKGEIVHGTIAWFSYSELEYATDKFSNSNLIGLGGSSLVYHGQLKNGQTVAVKRLKAPQGPDLDDLFSKEVELLARLHHCHVVPLLGYCSEFKGKHSERLLVFEYMPNGNLRDCLDGAVGENMSWAARVTIAIGAARGLEYLHEAAAPRILHRDVKSTNILLDQSWRAKITDLGFAKRLRADGVPSSSNSPVKMQGTFGYFAPECAMVGRASLMSDVFSFGVVLLELITGRQPIHKSTNKGEESLVLWATPRLHDSSRVISELPDPRLKGDFPEEDMQIMAYLAKECLLLDPEARPTMSEVVQILSTIAPDRSKRINIPLTLSQMSSTWSMRSELCIEKHENKAEAPVDEKELRRDTSTRQASGCPLQLFNDHTLIVGNNTDNIPTEYMTRLILLTSKARSWHAQDDESVDLTEPRFESFNIKSP